jgi:hypothetical protein
MRVPQAGLAAEKPQSVPTLPDGSTYVQGGCWLHAYILPKAVEEVWRAEWMYRCRRYIPLVSGAPLRLWLLRCNARESWAS